MLTVADNIGNALNKLKAEVCRMTTNFVNFLGKFILTFAVNFFLYIAHI